MSIFNRKIKPKHIEPLANQVADLLETELPQIKAALPLTRINSITFLKNPEGIFISRFISPSIERILKSKHNSHFNLEGIFIYNKVTKQFQPISLYFQFDTLTRIEVSRPEYFHKNYDLNQIQCGSINISNVQFENPDEKLVRRILKTTSNEQIKLLDLESTFEIVIDDKPYYTILEMEDGNYIAIDKIGKVYCLIHDNENMSKLIADNPSDFFKLFSGNKSELEYLFKE